MIRCSDPVNDTRHPTSYRAPHSGQMRITRYTSRVDLTGEFFPASALRNEVWNPYSYPQAGHMRNSSSMFVTVISFFTGMIIPSSDLSFGYDGMLPDVCGCQDDLRGIFPAID